MNLNLISIGALKYLKNRFDKNYWWRMDAILNKYQNHFNIDTTDMHNTYIDIKKAVNKFKNKNKTIIFVLGGPDIGNQNNTLINYEKYSLIYDIEDFKIWKQQKFIDKYHIKNILYRYKCSEADKLKQSNPQVNFFHFPHYINDFQNINKKTIDILFYGTISYTIYPLRTRLKTLLINLKKKSKLNIRIIEKSEGIYGKELFKLINKSYLTVSTPSIEDYLLAKYIEIILGNSMILGDLPTQETELFENKHVNINKSDSNETIEKKILDALKNKDIIIQNTNYLRNKFTKKFVFSQAFKDFKNILSKIS